MGADIPKIDRASHLKYRFHDRFAVRIVQPFARDHHAAALPVDQLLYVPQERRFVERPLRQINQVRTAHAAIGGERGRRGYPSGVPSKRLNHHNMNRQSAHIRADLCGRDRHIARRAPKPGAVVGHRDVIVHRLGNPHHRDSMRTALFVNP